MKRFDHRSKDKFCKDIKFSTSIETFLFKEFAKDCRKKGIPIKNIRDNGADNSGEFVESGTFGADYKIDLKYLGKVLTDHPIEVKFVPTFGKLTLKLADVRAYIREKASILFFFTSEKVDLKKPKHYDAEKHIQKIKENLHLLRWGIMFHDDVVRFYEKNKGGFKNIPYMGNKLGIVLDQGDFHKWFVPNKFE